MGILNGLNFAKASTLVDYKSALKAENKGEWVY